MENPAMEFENFDRLVEQYRPRVLRFLFASLRDMDLAESLGSGRGDESRKSPSCANRPGTHAGPDDGTSGHESINESRGHP
jgi:hypothetical protein